eukprot:tig00020951_g16399.t1
MRLFIFGKRCRKRFFSRIPPADLPISLRFDLLETAGPIKHATLQSLSHVSLRNGEGVELDWQDLGLTLEFSYRGVDAETGQYSYRVRATREGYSKGHGEGVEGTVKPIWTPTVRFLGGAPVPANDNSITTTLANTTVEVIWQPPDGAWTQADRYISGLIQYCWEPTRTLAS